MRNLAARAAMMTKSGGAEVKRYSLYHATNTLAPAYYVGTTSYATTASSASCWVKKLAQNGNGMFIGNSPVGVGVSLGSTNGWSATFGGESGRKKNPYVGVVLDGIAWKFPSSSAGNLSGWHHLCVTLGSSYIRLYIDGVASGSESFSSVQSAKAFSFCGSKNNEDGRGFAGYVCRPCWWSRTLSASEVLADYNAGSGDPDSTNLKCYCKMTSPTDIVDSVNNYNFTYEGALVEDTPWSNV